MIGFYRRLKWLITGSKSDPKPCNCGRNLPVDVFGNQVMPNEPVHRVAPLSQDTEETADIDYKQSLGLGDTIAKATSAVGIKPCEGCKRRKEALNRAFPYGQKNTDNSKAIDHDADTV